jgi:type IV pilus assembly protein PilN
MPRINLLPWREEQRKETKLKFAVAMGVAGVAALATMGAAYVMFGSMIQAQVRRNDQLRTEIKTLDKQIEEINNLESAKQKFIARMRIIEQLQRSRPEIVHVFDAIVRTLPEGVYLTSVRQNALKLKFEGVAQSSTRVSSFMRNIDGSDWLKNPELEVVQTAKTGTAGSSFTLTADEVSVAAQADDANGNGKGGRKGPRGGKVMASNGGRQ